MGQDLNKKEKSRRKLSPAEDELLNRVRMLESELNRTKRLLNILGERDSKINIVSESEMNAVIVMRSNGEVAFWNKTAERIFGYTQEEMLGNNLHKLIAHSKYKVAYEKGIYSFKKTGEGIAIGKTLKLIGIKKGGENVPIELTLNSSKVGDEWVATGVICELSEKRKIEKQRQVGDTATLMMEETIPDAVIIMNTRGEISFWNKAAIDIFGYSAEEITGHSLHEILAPERYHQQYLQAMKKFRKTGEGEAIGRTIELVAKRKSNEEFPIELSLTSVKMGNDWIAIGIARDVSNRDVIEKQIRMTNEELEILATTDSLTGLSNRYFFDEKLRYEWEIALRQQKPISLIFADIDHFKVINDTYGHLVGDLFLRSIADIIKNNVQRVSDVTARYGGEEFVILLPNAELANAIELAEKIRVSVQNWRQKIAQIDKQLSVTISLGVSCVIPKNTIHMESLVESSDRALYKAKSNGRNQVSSRLVT